MTRKVDLGKYRIENEDRVGYDDSRRFSTLSSARASLRKDNGGKLHGKFEVDYPGAVEGWNLYRHEGCATAVILRVEVR